MSDSVFSRALKEQLAVSTLTSNSALVKGDTSYHENDFSKGHATSPCTIKNQN